MSDARQWCGVTAVVDGHSKWQSVASYAVGVWSGLTAWAALAQYVLPGRGHALGKLGSFHWVLLINVFPALLCALGFAFGRAVVRRSVPSRLSSWRGACWAARAWAGCWTDGSR